jgi:hypothetical protein
MERLTDPVEIFQLLEKADQAEFDFTKHHSSFFPAEHYFAVLVYCASGKMKGPRLYLLQRPVHYSVFETELIPELIAATDDAELDQANTLAVTQLRNILESLPPSSFFFDAH